MHKRDAQACPQCIESRGRMEQREKETKKQRNKERESWEEGGKDPMRDGEVTCTFLKNNCSQL